MHLVLVAKMKLHVSENVLTKLTNYRNVKAVPAKKGPAPNRLSRAADAGQIV